MRYSSTTEKCPVQSERDSTAATTTLAIYAEEFSGTRKRIMPHFEGRREWKKAETASRGTFSFARNLI
jgi:hypothetical protein